jgi:hypothetical protein
MLHPVPRFFNTAGPNNPDDHYTLPVLARLPSVRTLIEQKLYFVLHAPRQVGKTTSLLTLARELTAEGTYAAVLLSMETGAPFVSDPGAAEAAVLSTWQDDAIARLPADLLPPAWPEAPPGSRISRALAAWASALDTIEEQGGLREQAESIEVSKGAGARACARRRARCRARRDHADGARQA